MRHIQTYKEFECDLCRKKELSKDREEGFRYSFRTPRGSYSFMICESCENPESTMWVDDKYMDRDILKRLLKSVTK